MNEAMQQPWAAALGRVASGLYVVTARHGDLEKGILGSWVQQCSFEPPLVSVALHHGGVLESWLMPGDSFVLNVIAEDDRDALKTFGKKMAPAADLFAPWLLERTSAGCAVLTASLAFLECRVESLHRPGGDHELVIGRVVGGRMLREGKPMVHVRKNGLHY